MIKILNFVFKVDKFLSNIKEEEGRRAILEVRKSIFNSFFIIIVSLIVGLLMGYITGLYFKPDGKTINIIQGTGALILLWGTISYKGAKILTWEMNSLAEEIDNGFLKWTYIIGTFLIVFTYVWSLM